MREWERRVLLWAIDQKWMEQLADMDYLREHIGLRGYAHQDPFVEYSREAYEMFQAMLQRVREETLRWVFYFEPVAEEAAASQQVRVHVVSEVSAGEGGDGSGGTATRTRRATKQRPAKTSRKVGPNDPCPCGSGKKYKKCCMLKEQQG
ncbi:MAG: SEC-C metal-binding domain-containing protein [Armatimonadetes bacterium]|nr:SEC-C metal-binding domain-containing protein [Armatimonadota bacterium]